MSRLAGIVFESRFPIDRLLAEVAASLRSSGLDLAGVVQVRVEDTAIGRSNLMLRGLRGGWELPILEDRGTQAKGCRLDPRAIVDVAGRLDPELTGEVDLLIVNRFGRAESEGYGLRHLLEKAAAMDIPVLIAVRRDYVEAWEAFHGGLGTTLAPERDGILAWCRGATSGKVKEDAAGLAG